MAAEANDPHVVLPRAVFGTIIIVTLLYCLAAFALVGMQNYQDISSDSCFSDAFRSRGWGWAAQLVSVGELICLPLVALVSFLAQPRIQYAMSIDGLLPKVFGEVDDDGNLYKGIVISGLVCTIIALFVPFTYLDDMISAGVLFSFNLTNTSLVVIRRGRFENSNSSAPYDLCSLLLIVYHVVATALAGLLANIISGNGGSNPVTISFSAFLFLVCFAVGSCIAMNCPENTDPEKRSQYRAPYMPFPPLFGIIINYVLIAQLSMLGIALIVCYYVLATIFYFLYCFQKDDTISMRCYSSLLTPISGRKNSTMSQDSDDFDSHMNNQAYHKVATDADEDNPKYSAEIGKISAHDKVSIKQQPSSPMW
jgi:APA family basic amino acid/polyamine antiporter